MQDAERARRNPRYLKDCEFPATLVATADLDADCVTLQWTSSSRHPAAPGHTGNDLRRRRWRPRRGHRLQRFRARQRQTRMKWRPTLGISIPICAVLSGPTFAAEFGRGLPTAVIIASKDAAFAERIAHRLNGGGFRASPATTSSASNWAGRRRT